MANFVFKSYSSKFGWGGVNEDSSDATRCLLDKNACESHIIYLELLAGFNTIKVPFRQSIWGRRITSKPPVVYSP